MTFLLTFSVINKLEFLTIWLKICQLWQFMTLDLVQDQHRCKEAHWWAQMVWWSMPNVINRTNVARIVFSCQIVSTAVSHWDIQILLMSAFSDLSLADYSIGLSDGSTKWLLLADKDVPDIILMVCLHHRRLHDIFSRQWLWMKVIRQCHRRPFRWIM